MAWPSIDGCHSNKQVIAMSDNRNNKKKKRDNRGGSVQQNSTV